MNVQPPWRKFPDDKPGKGKKVKVRASARSDGMERLDTMATWTTVGWEFGGGPEHEAAIYAWAPITLSELREVLNKELGQHEEIRGLRFSPLSDYDLTLDPVDFLEEVPPMSLQTRDRLREIWKSADLYEISR